MVLVTANPIPMRVSVSGSHKAVSMNVNPRTGANPIHHQLFVVYMILDGCCKKPPSFLGVKVCKDQGETLPLYRNEWVLQFLNLNIDAVRYFCSLMLRLNF